MKTEELKQIALATVRHHGFWQFTTQLANQYARDRA